jgi:guanyl-specific ribonuclease Sa
LVALLVLVAALAIGYGVRALSDSGSEAGGHRSTTQSVALSALPPEVARTVHLIEQGGPFPYPHNDGVVFHNFEHRLPAEPDGYYREYTVPTPGISTRGARRLITGKTGEFWYTSNHYDTFDRVDVTK